MNMKPIAAELAVEESVGLLPEAAIQHIQDVLFIDAPGSADRERKLELYCKMMFNTITLAESKLIAVNKRNHQLETMFSMWKPRIAAIRNNSKGVRHA